MSLRRIFSKYEVQQFTALDVHAALGTTILPDGFPFVLDPFKSKGYYMHDGLSGRKYLDVATHFASWPLTHNHPKMLLDEFKKGIGEVALYNPAQSEFYTIPQAQYVATMSRVCMQPDFKHAFFVQGGAQGVENAMKAAMDWKVRKNLSRGKGERGHEVIHFKDAFHGRTGYALSCTNTADPRKYMYFPLFPWARVENPMMSFPFEGENRERTIQAERRAEKQLRSVLEERHLDVAAIILEPIQGEGGDNHFRPEFWQLLRRLADEFEVMLIADEVQSGIGLTGKIWAHQHLGTAPDLVAFGKKMQVCGFISTGRIDEVERNVFKESSRIDSTWAGNLVDMVRARRVLEIIEEDSLLNNATVVGSYLLNRIRELQAKYPDEVSNVRGRGLMCAFDLKDGDRVHKFLEIARAKDVLMLPSGTHSVRIRPPLDVKEDFVDILFDALDCILQRLRISGY